MGQPPEASGRTRKLMLAWSLASLAFVAAGAFTARADGPSTAAPRVRYEAPASCPDRDDFTARVRARLNADGAHFPTAAALTVQIREHAGSVFGRVLIELAASRTQRSLEGFSCREVVDGLALIAALALAEPSSPTARPRTRRERGQRTSDPGRNANRGESTAAAAAARGRGDEAPRAAADRGDAAARGRGDEAPRAAADRGDAAAASRSMGGEAPRAAADRGNAAAARGRDDEAQRTASDRGEAAAVRSISDEAPRAAADRGDDATATARGQRRDAERPAAERGDRPQADGTAADRGDDAAAAAARRQAEAERTAADSSEALQADDSAVDRGESPQPVRIGTSVLALHGVAPAIQPGLQLQAAFTLVTGAATLQLRVGARMAWRDTLRSAQGDARFDFAAGVFQLCATSELGRAGFTLSGCVVAEPGVHRASADRTQNPRNYTRPWLATGVGAELGVRAASWLEVRAGAELLAPIRRDRMLLANEPVYQAPILGLRLQLGIEIPLG